MANITIMIMKNMSIIMTMNADVDMITITKNMSIIMTMNADADMITITKNMSIIMTMNVDADMIIMTITIIMQMKYLQAGVVRQSGNLQEKILRKCLKLFLHQTSMVSFFVQKVCFRQKMEHGSTLIWFLKKQRSAKAHRNTQAVSA